MSEAKHLEGGIVLTAEQKQRRRARSVAIGLALFGLVALFYVITLVKMAGVGHSAGG